MYRGEKDIIAGVKLLNYPLKFVTTRQVVHTKWHLQQTGFGKAVVSFIPALFYKLYVCT